jgi:formylglycine-generating enzyme required for sulfatase activity
MGREGGILLAAAEGAMDVEAALLTSIPGDPLAVFALADYLEERDDPRGELLRLVYVLTRDVDVPGRREKEERLGALLAAGVRPVGPYETVTLAPGVDLVLAWVPPGTFLMGSPPDEEGRIDSETLHRVTLTVGFWLGVHPVTQAQWRAVMGTDPSYFKGDDLPVESVSWEEARDFAAALTKKCDDKHLYRLPTEAEWEYSCRGGRSSSHPFGVGDGRSLSSREANFDGNFPYGGAAEGPSLEETSKVGSYPANALGLFDMHGNVWEWCADRYGPYPEGEVTNPDVSSEGPSRVFRGGGWGDFARGCRAAIRGRCGPGDRDDDLGFRLARSVPSGGK